MSIYRKMKRVKVLLFVALIFAFSALSASTDIDAIENASVENSPCIPPPNPKISDVSYEYHGCGNGVTLTATPSEGAEAKYHYVWEGSQNNVITVYTSGSIGLSTLKGSNCYSMPIMVSVTVQEVPPTPSITEVSDECGYVDLGYIDAGDGTQYYWQSSSSTFESSNSENPRRVEASGSYYLRAKKGTCWSSIKTKQVSVKQLPAISGTLIPVLNRCGYSEVNMPAETSENSFYWQTDFFGTNQSNSRKQDFTVYQEDTQKTFYLRGKHKTSGCWNDEDETISFTANPKTKVVEPIGSVSINSKTCGSTELKLPNAKTNETNFWVADMNGSSPQTGLKTFTADGTYFIQAKNNNSGCLGNVKSGSVDVKEVPPPPVIPSIPTEGCVSGDPVVLPLASNSGANVNTTYYWQSSSSGTSTSDVNGAKEVSESGRYYIRGYDSNEDCWGLARWYDVEMTEGPPKPSIDQIEQEMLGCGNGVRLTATPPEGAKYSYVWEGFGNNPITVYSSGTYKVYSTSSSSDYGGCPGQTLTVNVGVQEVPSVPEIEVLDPNTCGYVDLAYDKIAGVTYYWQSTDDLNSKQTDDDQYPKRIEEDGTYYLRAVKGGCWSNSIRSLTIAVPELPEIDSRFANVLNECGESTIIMPRSLGDATYYWQNSGLETNDDPARTNNIVVEQQDVQKTFYIRTKHNISGCWNAEELTFAKTASPLEVPSQSAGGVSVITDEVGLKVLAPPSSPSSETYYWQTDEYGKETIDTGHKEFTSDGIFILRAQNNNSLCWSEHILSGSVQVRTAYPLLISGNYIWEYSIKDTGITQESDFNSVNLDQANENIDYFDGIGRPIQSIQKQFSQSKRDVVTPVVYDEFGRSTTNFLGYSAELMLSNSADGSYKPTAIDDQSDFYNSHFSDTSGDYAFSETEFESSPLNRPLKTYAPGQTWAKEGGNKPITFDYQSNTTEEVIHWELEGNDLIKVTTYEAGTLYKTITTDENGSQVQEFKNLQGQVVLKKVQKATDTPNEDEDWLQTYYVYDDFGSLRYVLPPMFVENYLTEGQAVPAGTSLVTSDANYEDVASGSSDKIAFVPPATITINVGTTLEPGADIYSLIAPEDGFIPNQPFVDSWTFQYRYDSRQRMIKKQVPGADSVLMVYDQRDRLVMTQDGNQRVAGEWSFTKYDQLNRPVLTGVYEDSEGLNQAEMQAEVNAFYEASESNSDEYFENRGTALHGYTNQSFPKVSDGDKYLTVTYYDNYDFTADSHWDLGDYTTENQAKTYATGGKVRVDLPGSTYDWNETITLYDSRYRVASTVSQDYLGNKDTFVNEYYSLVHPLVVKTIHTHESAITGETTTITKDFDYDHADRLMSVAHQVNDETPVVVLKNEYNELGELVTKKLNDEGGGNFSQEVDYEYNIRGWLTRINDPVAPDPKDYFAMQLKYDEAGQYNGNIGAAVWKNPFEDSQNQYDYTYDPVNRLKSAAYNTNEFSVPNIDYDANGNILALHRKGLDGDGNLIDMDHLDYAYQGNQLTKVDETGSGDKDLGFKDGASATTEYEYDANGNMISDANKGIESIEYNHLNLPIKVTMSPLEGEMQGGVIEYIYDAAGTKLAQLVYEAGQLKKRTDYQGEFIYQNDTLQFIQHEEGRVVYETDVDGNFVEYEYQYHLKDHLGNVRATFKEEGDVDQSKATFEPDVATNESSYFTGYDGMVKITADLFNHTPGGNTSIRLNGSANEREGMGKSLKVKPGDVIDMEVYAKYFLHAESSGWTNTLNTLVSNIASNAGGIVIDGGGIGADANPFVDWSGKTNPTAAPEAYLNYLVFDDYYNLIAAQTGYQQISEAAKENGSDVAHEKLEHTLNISESGYVYIYLSNEEDSPIDVFFDDFTVTQHHTPIVSKDDYYPFGLTFASYNRPASVGQRFKYNQGTGEITFDTERISDLGLNWDMTRYRTYDYALGRFMQVDPLAGESDILYPWTTYGFSFNNPIRWNDPLGDQPPLSPGNPWSMVEVGFSNLFGGVADAVGNLFNGELLGRSSSSTTVKTGLGAESGKSGVEMSMNVSTTEKTEVHFETYFFSYGEQGVSKETSTSTFFEVEGTSNVSGMPVYANASQDQEGNIDASAGLGTENVQLGGFVNSEGEAGLRFDVNIPISGTDATAGNVNANVEVEESVSLELLIDIQ